MAASFGNQGSGTSTASTLTEPVQVTNEVGVAGTYGSGTYGSGTYGSPTGTAASPFLVTVSNPTPQGLTDAQLRASAPAVKDDYQAGECLADQTGVGGVLTFTFSAAVNLVLVNANGAATDIARVDPFGGTPSASLGIPVGDEIPTYLPVTATVVRVFAPSGMVVSLAGFRRA